MIQRRAFLPMAASAVLAGCNIDVGDGPRAKVGELRDETVTLDKSKVEMVSAKLHMAAGELHVRGGGTDKLMTAHFRYNVEPWKPEVRYDATGFRGRLTVNQGASSVNVGETKNFWDIQFAGDVPFDLDISCAAGESQIDLRELTLRSVLVQMGAGKVEMDLRGAYKKDLAVSVRGGVGQAIIRVPRNLHVIAEAAGGIGDIRVTGLRKEEGRWVSEAADRSASTIRLNVHGGIGEIVIDAG